MAEEREIHELSAAELAYRAGTTQIVGLIGAAASGIFMLRSRTAG